MKNTKVAQQPVYGVDGTIRRASLRRPTLELEDDNGNWMDGYVAGQSMIALYVHCQVQWVGVISLLQAGLALAGGWRWW